MSSIMKGIQGEQVVDKKQPEIQVPGYGTMPLDMLQRHVQSLSKEFNDSIQQGEFLKAAYRTEQFYNALMALAKALKQQGELEECGVGYELNPFAKKVDETHSTGTTAGSAGIGGGAGLGIEKSPMEKILDNPLGEGQLPPKAGFNKNPHKVGPGTSKDDYEYKKFIPRDRKEKGEEWAIARDVKNVNSRLGTKKPKELDTGFYKNYLGNRPVREEDLEESLPTSPGGMGQSYRKFTPKAAGLDEEQAPMFTPEEKMVNANDPRSDGWRTYEIEEVSNFLALKQRDNEFKKIFGTSPLFKTGDKVITRFSDKTENVKGTVVDFDIKTRKSTIKGEDGKLYFVHAQNLEKMKESAIMKGIQSESSEG